MTREEFIENITTFSELLGFCIDEHLDIMEGIYTSADLNDYVDSCIDETHNECSWLGIKDYLDAIPQGYSVYWVDPDDFLEVKGLTDSDFEDYKNRALREMDVHRLWDEGEECPFKPPSEPEFSESFSINELVSA